MGDMKLLLFSILPLIFLLPLANASDDGPISHYKFEDSWSLISFPLSDSSGNGHHGSVIATEDHYVDGVDGNAFNFNGQSIVKVDEALVTTNDEYTITAWVKKASGKLNESSIVYAEENFFNPTETKIMYWGFDVGNGNVELRIFQRDTSSGAGGDHNKHIDSGVPITDTNWHHLAWVQTSRTSYDVYVDGVKRETVDGLSFSGSFNPDKTHIGDRPSFGQHYIGQIDEVRTYDFALTEGMVLELFNEFDPAKVSQFDLKITLWIVVVIVTMEMQIQWQNIMMTV